MTIIESLKCISGYPIPSNTLKDIAENWDLKPEDEANKNVRKSKEYRLAKADVLMWLSKAPNVSQGGISYNFSDTDRLNFRWESEAIYKECGDAKKSIFGYKGSRL
ncbi:hypothetical protein [Bacteroides sp.]|uniref:hypothetical protein n=1 Tax=Bacteroides sp. TaxID=29523 RepID=UPI002A835046|nr:hypothetical protein [Bacteroides sp.]